MKAATSNIHSENHQVHSHSAPLALLSSRGSISHGIGVKMHNKRRCPLPFRLKVVVCAFLVVKEKIEVLDGV